MSKADLRVTISYYEKLLCAIADGEDDAYECDSCGGIYRDGWAGGKCPYCEVEHKGVVAIVPCGEER